MSEAQTRNVLLIGETGSGKSTFINYLSNYFLGGTPTSPKVVIPNSVYRRANVSGFPEAAEADLSTRAVSQTKSCLSYEFRKDGTTYRFIDTPGLSDTNLFDKSPGMRELTDDRTVHLILEAAEKAGTLHAIIVIVNGTVARVTVNLKNALERIAQNSPDILLNNMLAVFTNCSANPMNSMIESLPFTPVKSVAMDNTAFSSHSSEWDEDAMEEQEFKWKKSRKSINEIVEQIDSLSPQQTVCREMKERREYLKAQIMHATINLRNAIQTRERIQQLQLEEASVESDMRQTAAQLEIRNTPTPYHNTNCIVCFKTCHQNCNLKYSTTKGDEQFKRCACMWRGSSCGCGHDLSTHVHEMTLIATVKKSETVGDAAKRAAYEQQQRQLASLANEESQLRQEMQQARAEEAQCLHALQMNHPNSPEVARATVHLAAIHQQLQQSQAAFSRNQQSKQEIEQKRVSYDAELQTAEANVQKYKAEIVQHSQRLEQICSRFNFAKELEGSIAGVQMAEEAMTETQSREECEEVIGVLRKLAKYA